MATFTHYSAKAVVTKVDGGAMQEAVFTGLIDARAFACLQTAVMRHIKGARTVVLRYEAAAIMVSQAPPIDVSAYKDAPVIAAVVTMQFLEIAGHYAAGLGKLGVIAAVFSDSAAQVALAHRWAARHASASRSRWLV